MERRELAALAKTLGGVVRTAMDSLNPRFEEFDQRIKAIPAGPPGEKGDSIKGDTGPPGPAGKDADIGVICELITGEVTRAVAELPKPENGKDADPEVIRAEVAKAIAALPPPKDGRDGIDGKEVDLGFVLMAIAEETQKAVAAIPIPKDGAPGPPGESIIGPKGETGERGEKGDRGESIPPDPELLRLEAEKAVNAIFATVIQGFHETT